MPIQPTRGWADSVTWWKQGSQEPAFSQCVSHRTFSVNTTVSDVQAGQGLFLLQTFSLCSKNVLLTQRGSRSEPSKLVWDSDPQAHIRCTHTPSSYKELDRARQGTCWRERYRPCPHGAWILESQSGKFTNCMFPLMTLLMWQYSEEQTSSCQGTARGWCHLEGRHGGRRDDEQAPSWLWGDDMNLHAALNRTGGSQFRPVVCVTAVQANPSWTYQYDNTIYDVTIGGSQGKASWDS